MEDPSECANDIPLIILRHRSQPQACCRRPFYLVDEVTWVASFIKHQPNVYPTKYRHRIAGSTRSALPDDQLAEDGANEVIDLCGASYAQ